MSQIVANFSSCSGKCQKLLLTQIDEAASVVSQTVAYVINGALKEIPSLKNRN